MKTYAFKELTSATLAEVATIQHEPRQPAFWEELSRRELGEQERIGLRLIADKLLYYQTQRVNEATIPARHPRLDRGQACDEDPVFS